MAIESVGVIGGGAWGTALAQTLRLAGRRVTLWAREAETVEDINERHVNRTFLPGVPLDEGLRAMGQVDDLAAPARPRWPLDQSAPAAIGAGVKA